MDGSRLDGGVEGGGWSSVGLSEGELLKSINHGLSWGVLVVDLVVLTMSWAKESSLDPPCDPVDGIKLDGALFDSVDDTEFAGGALVDSWSPGSESIRLLCDALVTTSVTSTLSVRTTSVSRITTRARSSELITKMNKK